MADDLQVHINVQSNADEATRGLDKLGSSVAKNLKVAERLEKQYKTLATAFNKGKITAQVYAAEVTKVENAINRLNASNNSATKTTNKLAAAQMAATKQSNRMGVVTQQAGYQVSDFIVQVQSGTNVFVAFGQQASQLVGVLPLVADKIGMTARAAIALSASLGIIIPLITLFGASWLRSREAAEDAGDKLRTTEDILKDLKSSISDADKELRLLHSTFTDITQLEVVDQMEKLEQQIEFIKNDGAEAVREYVEALGGSEAMLKNAEASVAALAAAKQEQIDTLQANLDTLVAKQNLLDIEESYAELLGEILDIEEATEQKNSDVISLLREREALANAYLSGGDEAVKNEERLREVMALVTELQSDKYDFTEDQIQAILRQVKATQDLEDSVEDAKEETKALEEAAKEAAKAFEKMSGFSEGLDEKIAVAAAELEALGSGGSTSIAKTVAQLNYQADALYETKKATGELTQADRDLYVETKAQIAAYNAALVLIEDKEAAIKAEEKATREAAKAYKLQLQEAEKLRKELEGPMVTAIGTVSDAFGDFIARGLTDFKGFVKQILASFQNMIAQMIAMAVRNRIMLSLGIGGVTPAAAAAGQVAGLGSASTMLGSIGTGTGFAGIAGGTGFLGGAANTLSGLAGGGAGFFNVAGNAALAGGGAMATIGAALPIVGLGLALFSLFKKKPAISPENMAKVNQALKMTGQELDGTGREAQKAAAALGEVAGGFDKLTKKAQAFYEGFYTEGERRTIAINEATQALNKTFAELEMAVPKTHSEFRQLVEAQDLMTEEGRETYNALLDISGAFVTLNGTMQQAAERAGALRREELALEEARAVKAGEKITEQYVAKEIINQQIEALGTTAELNEYLITELDRVLSIKDVPASVRTQYLEKAKEQLDGFIEDTTYVQNIQREFYEGIKVPVDQMKSMLKDIGGTRADLSAFERFGELGVGGRLSAEFMEKFGKYGMYKVLPYTTQIELFIKEISQVIGKVTEAVRTINFRGDLGVLNKKIEVSADRVSVGYAALASGYRKIVEAVDKVESYYERDFANLRTEYTGAAGLESSTAVKSITDRISGILDLPKRLVGVIENSMRTLGRQADKLDNAFSKVQREYFEVKHSGLQVSEGLQKSYREMLSEREAAGRAADEAQKRVKQLTLFIRTVEGAVQGFKDSVERVVTSPIEDALAVFLPTELDSLAQDVRTQIKEILGSMGEGTLDTFETGLVTLSDLLASNTITVDQFNNSFKLMQDVFEGNVSLTEQYTTKQQSVVEKLSSAYDDFTSKLQNLLGVVRGGIESLIGQATDVNAVANRRGSLAYLRAVASTGQVDASRLESAVGVVTSGDISGFGTRQEFLRYVADTTSLLRTVEGTLSGQLDTLEMQQVKAILNIQDTNETAATSLQSIQALLAEFLGVGGRIPTFATGGYHSGGLRIVGERGPELEATGPSRIIPAGQFSMGGDAELRREVAELRVDLKAALVQIAKNTRKSSDTLNKFDYQGLPNSRGY